MCLAVPGKIVRLLEAGEHVAPHMAIVDFHGSQVEVSLAMAVEAKVGDHVLVHAGYAIAVVDEREAQETWACLQEIEQFNQTQTDQQQ